MQFDDAPAAELVPHLCTATAEVVSEKPGLVAYVAWFLWSVQMGNFGRGHPEESASSGLGPVGSGVRVPLVRVLWRAVWRGMYRCYIPLILPGAVHLVSLLAEMIGSG